MGIVSKKKVKNFHEWKKLFYFGTTGPLKITNVYTSKEKESSSQIGDYVHREGIIYKQYTHFFILTNTAKRNIKTHKIIQNEIKSLKTVNKNLTLMIKERNINTLKKYI